MCGKYLNLNRKNKIADCKKKNYGLTYKELLSEQIELKLKSYDKRKYQCGIYNVKDIDKSYILPSLNLICECHNFTPKI